MEKPPDHGPWPALRGNRDAELEHAPAIVEAGAFANDRERGSWSLVGLFSLTLFISALLLFSIQPIFAKMLLPLLGGAPAVWNAAMLFYQAALLAGYAYAHFASKYLPARIHLISHMVFLALPFAVLPFQVPAGSQPTGGANPVPWLLITMSVAIGAPFFVVSATGPLLQRWFSRTGHPAAKDPYFLYAASNLGSMIGLLGYPFLIEPKLRLAEQSRYWEIGYGVLAGFIVFCAISLRSSSWLREAPSPDSFVTDLTHDGGGDETKLRWSRKLRWIALAFVPSSLMLGVTQYISTDVAAVPLLWVIPLALYLMTFTIVFARRPIIPHWITLVLMPVTLGGLVSVMALNLTKPMEWIVGVHILAFFFVAMLCHGELARDRPPVGYLTEFYLWMSVGGVLGGFFNAIVAPLVFPVVLEYPLALVGAAMLYPGTWRSRKALTRVFDFVGPALVLFFVCAAIALERRYGLTSSIQARTMFVVAGVLGCLLFLKRPLRFGIAVGAMLGYGIFSFFDSRTVVYVERSFFGVTRIERSGNGSYTDIFHGTTLHGTQATAPGERSRPTTYYARSGPIGVVLMNMRRPPGGSYAVVGLGSGTLAAYARLGEHWTYYEIDPVIVRVAQDPQYFTFLSDAKAPVKISLGDARLSLKDSRETYDLLVLDAYSSDAVPIHLLTKQALSIYLQHTKQNGIIAFHISNKHLELGPVIHELCQTARLESKRFLDGERISSISKAASDWIIAYRKGTDVNGILAKGDWKPTVGKPGVGLWTDDFSSIWTIYGK